MTPLRVTRLRGANTYDSAPDAELHTTARCARTACCTAAHLRAPLTYLLLLQVVV